MRAVVIALDVGGSAIKSGLVSLEGRLLDGPLTAALDSHSDTTTILNHFTGAIRRWLPPPANTALQGIAIAMPGPFDYEKGISLIRGVAKYDSLYSLDVGRALRERLGWPGLPIRFRNDAEAAILGEVLYGAGRDYGRIIGITLGTGIGSAFIVAGSPVEEGPGVPPHGWLYGECFEEQTADELFSDRGLRRRLLDDSGRLVEIGDYVTAARAGEEGLRDTFLAFGRDLGRFLRPYAADFNADLILALGGIAQAYDLFGPAIEAEVPVVVKKGELGAAAALLGVARVFW